MKELFDELRDQLPADRGMKASKWEILSKGESLRYYRQSSIDCGTAIDFVTQLKQSHQELAREVDLLRQENESLRQVNLSSLQPNGALPHVLYAAPGAYAGPSSHQQRIPQQNLHSRPESSQSAQELIQNGNGPT